MSFIRRIGRVVLHIRDDWQEQPRVPAGSSEGGQFSTGGGGGAGAATALPPKPAQHKASVAKLQALALSGGDVHAVGEQIKELAGQYIHPTVASYANKLLAHLENTQGLAPGELGKAKPKVAGAPAEPAAAEPEPAAEEKPERTEPPPVVADEDLDPEPGNAFQNLIYGLGTIGSGSPQMKAAAIEKVLSKNLLAPDKNVQYAQAWVKKLGGAEEQPAEGKLDPETVMEEVYNSPHLSTEKKIEEFEKIQNSPLYQHMHKLAAGVYLKSLKAKAAKEPAPDTYMKTAQGIISDPDMKADEKADMLSTLVKQAVASGKMTEGDPTWNASQKAISNLIAQGGLEAEMAKAKAAQEPATFAGMPEPKSDAQQVIHNVLSGLVPPPVGKTAAQYFKLVSEGSTNPETVAYAKQALATLQPASAPPVPNPVSSMQKQMYSYAINPDFTPQYKISSIQGMITGKQLPETKEYGAALIKHLANAPEPAAQSNVMGPDEAAQFKKGVANNLEFLPEPSKVNYLENLLATKSDTMDPDTKAFVTGKLEELKQPKTPTQMVAAQPELMPNASSKHQQALAKVAMSHTLPVEEKIAQLKEYPTVKEYPDGFTAKFANSWVKALGGEPIPNVGFAGAPAATPAAPSAGPQPVFKPPTPPKPQGWKPASLGSEIDDATYATYQKAAPKPQPDERQAIHTYTGGDYSPINNALRAGDPLPPHLHKQSKDLQDYLLKASWPEDGTVVTRKVSGSYAKSLQSKLVKGSIFRDHGFVSTDHWSGDLTIKIHLKKGANAAAVKQWSANKPEDEIVLARGTQFRVLDYEKGNNYIRVEALTPDDPEYIH
jgi:hypothetical protein